MFDTSETEENAYEVEKVIRKNTWHRSMLRNDTWTYAKSGSAGKGSRLTQTLCMWSNA